MVQEERKREQAEANQEFSSSVVDWESKPPETYRQRIESKLQKTCLQDIGNTRAPYSEEAFSKRIAKKLSLGEGARMAGFSRYASAFRDDQLKDLFIRDDGAIPKDRKFQYHYPCPIAFPGLCAQRDAALLRVILPIQRFPSSI